jgi:hypothetical protein
MKYDRSFAETMKLLAKCSSDFTCHYFHNESENKFKKTVKSNECITQTLMFRYGQTAVDTIDAYNMADVRTTEAETRRTF